MANQKIPKALQPMAIEHYHKLIENKRRAEDALQNCIADLLAFEVVLRRPEVIHDWPGRNRQRLRAQLMALDEMGGVPASV